MVVAIGVIVVMIMLMFSIAIILIGKQAKKTEPEYFFTYMQQQGTNFSFSLKYNGTLKCAVNSQKKRPLANCANLVIGMEFARQVSEGHLDKNELISLSELELFHIPATDGGAYPEWLSQLRQKQSIQNNQVKLIEVAKGMMAFSSNANMEYLLNRLGIDAINQQLNALNLNDHEPLYHFCAAVMIPAYLAEQGTEKIEDRLTSMTQEEYVTLAGQIAVELADGNLQELKQKVMPVPEKWQRIWSDRLPRGTTADYLHLMELLNQKVIFSKEMHKILDEVLETVITNPRNQAGLKHAGQKDGSTAWVLTLAAYFTDKHNNTSELVFFANDLEPVQLMKLQENVNPFMLKMVKDEEFRNRSAQVKKK